MGVSSGLIPNFGLFKILLILSTSVLKIFNCFPVIETGESTHLCSLLIFICFSIILAPSKAP